MNGRGGMGRVEGRVAGDALWEINNVRIINAGNVG